MYAMDLLLRVMHILGAVMLLGGIFFQVFAYRPARNGTAEDASCGVLRESIRRGGSIMAMIAITLLLISGLANTAFISIRYQLPKDYHLLLAVKIVLALVLFALASLLTGRSSAAEKVRANASLWLNVAALAGLLLLGVAAAMKMTERQPKADEPQTNMSRTVDAPEDFGV